MAAGESAREEARRAREKAERMARRAEMFERAADGEELTAQVLSELGLDWVSLHDHRWPGRRLANIDHVVVGPGGIFVIDSKNWTGDLRVDGQTLRQNGRSREKSVAGAADAALAVAELVAPYADAVRPVLCFVGDQDLSGWSREVMVCSTSNLATMLTSREPVLDADQVADAARRLDLELRSASAEQGTAAVTRQPARATPERVVKTQASCKSRRRSPSPVRLLALAGGALALYVSINTVLPAIGDGASDRIVDVSKTERRACTPTDVKREAGATPKQQKKARNDC